MFTFHTCIKCLIGLLEFLIQTGISSIGGSGRCARSKQNNIKNPPLQKYMMLSIKMGNSNFFVSTDGILSSCVMKIRILFHPMIEKIYWKSDKKEKSFFGETHLSWRRLFESLHNLREIAVPRRINKWKNLSAAAYRTSCTSSM